MVPYELRAAQLADEDQLFAVAKHLNTVNLPHDREAIRRILSLSQKSFLGEIPENRREYVFVLSDVKKKRVIGTSMIISQLGRRGAPYIYFDVLEEEKYSETRDKHFHHTVLRIGYSYNGPTEIGGLILDPDYRRVPERLGQFLSYVRFLYIAAHRSEFRPHVLAELLPPLGEDGTSHLWEALGRHFTDMSYSEADVLSKQNKEFIKQLFPDGFIYASLLSKEAQDVIGKVGSQTKGVEKMLRRIGFRYAQRVDPFDGGPHFLADTDEISLVRRTRREKVTAIAAKGSHPTRGLVAVETKAAPFFRCIVGGVGSWQGGASIGQEVAEHLGISVGDEVVALELD